MPGKLKLQGFLLRFDKIGWTVGCMQVYETGKCHRFFIGPVHLLKFHIKQLLLTLQHAHACGR